jgi:hypothetical protein
MFLGLVFIAALISVPLARGRLTQLADIKLRRAWLAPAGIGVQILIISVIPAGSAGFHEAVHMLSYAILGAFAWSNRRIPGVPIIMLGGALNFIAIAANGGVMPADPDAIEAAGIAHKAGFTNSAAASDAPLGVLGDVFHTPAWLPIHNVFSVGDIEIVIGAFLLLHFVCRSKLVNVPFRLRTAEA